MDPRLQRLEMLADLWGKLYLFHPNVAVQDLDWEGVLARAIPPVEAARTTDELVAALNAHLFAPLGDPLALAQRAAPANRAPRSRPAGGVRRLAPSLVYWDASDVGAYGPAFLRRAVTELRAVGAGDTLVVDLRWTPTDGTPYYIGLGALAPFVRAALRPGYHVARVHEGWAERGALPCEMSSDCELFRQFWQVEPTYPMEPLWGTTLDRPVVGGGTPSDTLRPVAVPTVFLVNTASATRQDQALDALQSQDDVAVVLEKTGAFSGPGILRYPQGVEAQLDTWTLVSHSGALGFRSDVVRGEAVPDQELAAVAREALRAKRERRDDPRPRFAHQMRVPPTTPFSAAPLSREERLVGLFKIWTVVRSLDPFLEYARVDWSRMLPEWIPRVEAAPDLRSYVMALREIGATLNDSHVSVQHPAGAGYPWKPPVRLQHVEGRLIVTEMKPASGDTIPLSLGEEILAVDGRPVAAVEAEWRRISSASTPQGFSKLLWEGHSQGLGGPENSTAELTVRGAAGTRRVKVRRSLRQNAATNWVPRDSAYFRVLPGNLGYISGYLIPNGATIDSALAALQNTDGLVVDMRGYPREATFWLTRRLTDVPLRRPKVEIPIAMWKPGAESAACCGRLRVQTDELELRDGPRYRKPVVVLINAVPQSAAEADVMILRQRPRVRVVGTPTTGAVGTVTQVLVPSGARFFFTGSVWYNPDGSRVQNIGILPDVHVAPTIRGVRAGRDEILEAGIGVLKEMLAGQLGR